jgi:hypothetical protein
MATARRQIDLLGYAFLFLPEPWVPQLVVTRELEFWC